MKNQCSAVDETGFSHQHPRRGAAPRGKRCQQETWPKSRFCWVHHTKISLGGRVKDVSK